MTTSIYLCGVGGQGTILISQILSAGLAEMGYDVKMSEIHGMSQRGGSVVTQIRFGEKIYSPVIGEGEADIIVAFEKAEALRALPYLKKNGTIIVDSHEIMPMTVLTGAQKYPHDAIQTMSAVASSIITINAHDMAASLGNVKVQNIVLLGALVRVLATEQTYDWSGLIAKMVPPKAKEINLKAYEAGHAMHVQ